MNSSSDNNIQHNSPFNRRIYNEKNLIDILDRRLNHGICGSQNLGNTCYMNSSIACISNCSELTYYFLSKKFYNDINKSNRDGAGGKLAIAWSQLIEYYWNSKYSYGNPKEIKRIVGAKIRKFSGYQQQDSNEFMTVFLEILGEDLNNANKKIYLELKEQQNGETDVDAAQRFWKLHIKRNDKELIEQGIAIKIKEGFFSWGNNSNTQKDNRIPEGMAKSRTMFKLAKNDTKEIPSAQIIQLNELKTSYQPLSEEEEDQKSSKRKATNKLLNEISEKNDKIDNLLTGFDDKRDDGNINGKDGESDNYSEYSGTVVNLMTEDVVLRDIDLEIKKGEFILIIGEVGSGKSSLVQAILNNMTFSNPNCTELVVNGTISYVGQEAWIQNNTVQSNILFYKTMDLNKYEEIINLCELKQDLDILPGGDMTEIGEKGVNLSGGQKARISLARAMYSDNDIFILDDPISALDAHVGKKIMKNCIIDYLKNKTRILVTHALQYASFADRIYYLKKGEIYWKGKYCDLIKQDFYCEIIKKLNSKKTNNQLNLYESKKLEEISEEERKINIENKIIASRHVSTCNEIKRITVDEKKEIGTINKSVYFSYFSYIGGVPLCLSLFSALFIWQILKIGSDIWLGYWSEHQRENSNLFFFSIYAGTAIGSTLFNYWRTKIITEGSLKLSKRLHTEMINSLIRAPINLFHDTVPKGQIFNRLSKDLPTVDTYSMFWLMTLTSFGGSFIGAVLVCVVYQPKCIFFIPFFICFCWNLSRFYMNCSRELTRIEGMLNSPILNIVNETIPGTTTIRAFRYESKYIDNFQRRVDEHYKLLFYLNGTNQWYLLCMNLLSFSLLSFIVLFTLFFKQNFTAENIGILLTYTIIVQDDMVEFLSAFSNFENTMTKMERSLSYTKINPEKPDKMKIDDSLINWPSRGEIIIEDLSVKYRDDCEIALKNISLHIFPGEHLGIVGRTGCGKSTLSLCLFRILEPLSGKIIIDDIDISKIGLKKLRSNLTIIPQDSTIMDGSLRYNLDPLNSYKDEDIIKVMKSIGFEYILEQNDMGLNQSVSENGSNLSVGEKQLICITRAILRKSKIVVMDEATASIDYKTEEIIQKALNTILFNSTLISIAHRIKTVLNSTKILVLSKGKMVEFDKPENLIKNKNSYFYDFYSKSLI